MPLNRLALIAAALASAGAIVTATAGSGGSTPPARGSGSCCRT